MQIILLLIYVVDKIKINRRKSFLSHLHSSDYSSSSKKSNISCSLSPYIYTTLPYQPSLSLSLYPSRDRKHGSSRFLSCYLSNYFYISIKRKNKHKVMHVITIRALVKLPREALLIKGLLELEGAISLRCLFFTPKLLDPIWFKLKDVKFEWDWIKLWRKDKARNCSFKFKSLLLASMPCRKTTVRTRRRNVSFKRRKV